MPSISNSIVSPTWIGPTPAGVPVMIMSPGSTSLYVNQGSRTVVRTVLANSAYNNSPLGLRGTEDLGGGFAAGFWLESPSHQRRRRNRTRDVQPAFGRHGDVNALLDIALAYGNSTRVTTISPAPQTM